MPNINKEQNGSCLRLKLVNESGLHSSLRVWLVVKAGRQILFAGWAPGCLPHSFYFERGGCWGWRAPRASGRGAPCAWLPPPAAHFLPSCPSRQLLLPGLHKGPTLLLLIFRDDRLFFLMTLFIFLWRKHRRALQWCTARVSVSSAASPSPPKYPSKPPLTPGAWFTGRKTVFIYIQRNTRTLPLLRG